jgi:hypothetical protein
MKGHEDDGMFYETDWKHYDGKAIGYPVHP